MPLACDIELSSDSMDDVASVLIINEKLIR